MRRDMDKVNTYYKRGKGDKRPKGYFKSLERSKRNDSLDDVLRESTSGPVNFGWDCRELTYNNKPLKRYLCKQVGRPWNDVYSEICSHSHSEQLKKYCEYVVAVKTTEIDGQIYDCDNGMFRILTEAYATLYVCPKTGILKQTPKRKKYSYEKRNVGVKIEDKRYLRINGVWYEVVISTSPPYTWYGGQFGLYPHNKDYSLIYKKQLSKKEIKALDLHKYDNQRYCNLSITRDRNDRNEKYVLT